MKNKKPYISVSILFVLVIMLVKMSSLQNTLGQMQSKITQLEELLLSSNCIVESNSSIEQQQDGEFGYLAIGNSITKHGICDYWWSEIGMAATSEQSDYYHLVCDGLREKYNKINAVAYNFSMWEIVNTDRAQTIQILDPYLNENVDLITIQLAENIRDDTTFKTDFEYLLEYIEQKCPKAQLIVIGSFWPKDYIDQCKKEVTMQHGHTYIDLTEIAMKEEYMCGLGTVVEGEDGQDHIVEHEGVAKHPNDKAFLWYAEKILECVE